MDAEERSAYDDVLRRLQLRPGDTCFDAQEAFIQDKSFIKAALCTRRAGKTYVSAIELLNAAESAPNSMSLYIALTRDSARGIMWPILEQLNRQFNLNAQMLESKLTMVLSNGSKILLRGADQRNFVERLLGAKYKAAVIDECQSFGDHLEFLIFDVLSPALLDLKGSISLIGTPGIRPRGFYYDITTKKQDRIPVYRWSLFDNPYLPNARQFVDELMQKQGWTEANPTYRRQYLGEWLLDLGSMVYKFTESNLVDEAPKDLMTIMGIDFGYSPDPCAFVILGYRHHDPRTYVIHAEKHAEMIPTDIAGRVKQLQGIYSPVKIVADTGGLGKSIAAELTRRHQIPVFPAEKKEKLANIQLINGAFIDKNLMIERSCSELIDELQLLTKDEDGFEDYRLPNHACDALLYSWRESQSYLNLPKSKEISRNSDEYMAQWEQAESDRVDRLRQNKSQLAEGEDW